MPIAVGPACAADVQVAVVEAHASADTTDVTITGAIEARIQSDLAFRITGKIVSRAVDVGQHVVAGQEIARLDDAQQRADVADAEAQLASRQAVLAPATIDLERQKDLLAKGFATRKRFEDADEAVTRARADVVSAQASLDSAKEQLSYVVLRSTGDGLIVARQVDVGAVVQPGTTVVTLALDGQRDAVFNVAETTMARPPVDAEVRVALTSDPAVRTTGRVREISPSVDATTNTVHVKVGLDRVPEPMTLGAAVTGAATVSKGTVTRLPWSALDRWGGRPSVWVLGADGKPETRPVAVLRYNTGTFDVTDGLKDGERVVSAGLQFLRPGTAVKVMPGGTP